MLRVMASGQVYRTNKHKKLCPGLMCMASLDYRMLKGEHLRCLAGRVRLAKPGKHPVQATSRPGTANGTGRALDGTAKAAGPPSRVSSGVPAVEADDSSGEPH